MSYSIILVGWPAQTVPIFSFDYAEKTCSNSNEWYKKAIEPQISEHLLLTKICESQSIELILIARDFDAMT